MSTELSLVLWFAEGDVVPAQEEIENQLECSVIEYEETEC